MNPPPPLEGYNLLAEDGPLVEALQREREAAWEERVLAFGELGGGEPLEWGQLANEYSPVLRTHDRFGNRCDEVEFRPAWHSLMGLAVEAGLPALPRRESKSGADAARAAADIVGEA